MKMAGAAIIRGDSALILAPAKSEMLMTPSHTTVMAPATVNQ